MLGIKDTENGLTEDILIHVWERMQWTELMKVKTIAQCIVNPEKASEAIDDLGAFMIPSYGELKKKRAKDMLKVYKPFRDKTLMVKPTGDAVFENNTSGDIFKRGK